MKLDGQNTRLYGSFSKVEENDDGTIIVEGIASTEAVDVDGEVVKADAMRDAMDGYMKFGNIREMHQPKAAGTALDCFVDDDGNTRLRGHIVDSEAVKKVKSNVYKGFSIGGRATSRDPDDKKIITGIRLYEISLVDRPANPEAVLEMWKADLNQEGATDMLTDYENEYVTKRDFSDKKRKALAKDKKALPDGSFPIENKEDLENAIKAIGRAKDEAKAKAHIIARAKALKATDLLPADWEGSTKKDEKAAGSDVDVAKAETEAKDEQEEPDEKPEADKHDEGLDEHGKPKKPGKTKDKTKADGAEPGADDVQKGLYECSQFAQLLQSLFWLQQCAEREAATEEDNSGIPARVKEAVANLGAILVDMTKEEVAELVGVEGDVSGDTVALAAMGVSLKKIEDATTRDVVTKYIADLEKKGARHSAADQARINSIHQTCIELGSTYEEDEVTANDAPDEKAAISNLTKLAGEMSDQLKKMADQNSELAKRVKELEAMPTPAKGATVIVSKADDAVLQPENEKLVKAAQELAAIKDPAQRGVFIMKTIHARGGHKAVS